MKTRKHAWATKDVDVGCAQKFPAAVTLAINATRCYKHATETQSIHVRVL